MDEREWTDRPLRAGETIELGATRIRLPGAPCALRISGDLTAAVAALAPNAPIAGLRGDVGSGPYAIRMARDSALLVSQTPLVASPGWREAGFAISDADDCYTAVEFEGGDALRILAQATTADLERPSPSAAIGVLGLTMLLVRRGEAHLLWVETPYLSYLTSFLRGASADID